MRDVLHTILNTLYIILSAILFIAIVSMPIIALSLMTMYNTALWVLLILVDIPLIIGVVLLDTYVIDWHERW